MIPFFTPPRMRPTRVTLKQMRKHVSAQRLQAVGRRQRAWRRQLRAAQRRGPVPVHPIVVPGVTRVGGFFGRFANGGEMKFHDLDIDEGTIAAGGTISEDSCNAIAQGTTESERIGRKCVIRSINWRFDIVGGTRANTAAPSGDIVRVILYLDKQCNGATAGVTDILESADYQSFNNLANKSRFRTLMDRTYQIEVVAGSGADATAEWKLADTHDDFYKNVNIGVEFDATTGAITEVRSNNIGVLLLSKNGVTTFTSKMRLRFSDA